MLQFTNIENVEKCIERRKKKSLGQIPTNFNELCNCLKHDNWKQLLLIDTADPFIIDFVIKNNDSKGIIFIDKNLTELLVRKINGNLTIFVDGTFATVPRLQNNNCQLWTIVIRHNNRVSKTIH